MAQQRDVQFNMDFNVENLNTIESLENSLGEMNNELKQLDTNSDAFKKLSAQAREADGKLKDVNSELEGITGPQRAEGVVKLADGLVGAFQIAAGASLIFGEKTSEELEKVIAKVGGLFAAMDGVKKITEALSAENIKFVKGAIAGFKKSAIAAKLFGTTTKAAVAATGIGLFLIAIGLIIANWDKLTKFIKKNAELIKKYIMFVAPVLYLVIEAVEALQKKFGDLQNLVAGVGAAIKAAFTFDGKGFDGIKKAFDETIEKEKELDKLREEYNEKLTKTQEAHENELEILKEQGAEQEVINEKIRERLEVEQKILKRRDELGDLSDDEKKRLKEINHQLVIQSIREKTLIKLRAKQAKDKAAADKKEIETAKEKKQQEINRLKIERETAIEKARAAVNSEIDKEVLKKLIELEQDRSLIIQGLAETTSEVITSENTILDVSNKILNSSQDYLNIKGQIKDITGGEMVTSYDRLLELEGTLGKQEYKRLVFLLSTAGQYNVAIYNNIKNAELLASVEEKFALDQEKYLRSGLELQIKANELRIQNTDNDNEKLKLLLENEKIRQEIIKSYNRENEIIADIVVGITKLGKVQDTNLQKTQEALAEYGDAAVEGLQKGFDIMNALRESSDLREQEAFAAKIYAQEEILDAFYKRYEKRIEEIAELKTSLGEEEEDLNDQLQDAEGDRYDDILSQLQDVQTKQAENAAAEAALEKARAEQEFKLANLQWQQEIASIKAGDKAAKAQKAQAAVMATIQTTLAVIEALPKVPLSIIVGALGAAGIAAILATAVPKTPLPPAPKAPEFAEGGVLNGPSHASGGIPIVAEGGEYVVNKDSTSKYKSLLDAINRPHFQDGGVVETSINTPVEEGDMIDYDRLARAIASQPISASWTEGQAVGRRVKFTESRSSI